MVVVEEEEEAVLSGSGQAWGMAGRASVRVKRGRRVVVRLRVRKKCGERLRRDGGESMYVRGGMRVESASKPARDVVSGLVLS
jgi:hypothetical protein